MNTSIPSTGTHKRFGQLDLYADGDPDFRQVLINLMINNLAELRRSITMELAVFRKACHKMKTTLAMLGSRELSDIVEELNHRIEGQDRIDTFDKLCGDSIKSLWEEKNNNAC